MPNHRKIYDPETTAKMLSLYRAGNSMNSIAIRFGLHQPAVAAFLKFNGVATRSRSESNIKYRVRGDAFRTPFSPLAAYFFGMLCADGCVDDPACRKSHQPRVRLALQDRDRAVVDEFCKFIGYTGRPRVEDRGAGKRSMVGVDISCQKIVDQLVSLGLTPRKSRTLCVDDTVVSDRDFWRGYMDGNGCVALRYTASPIIHLATASPQLRDQFCGYCSRIGAKHKAYLLKSQDTFLIALTGDGCRLLAYTLYHKPCFSMARKQKVADVMIAQHLNR